MGKIERTIVRIDADKCNGCGVCVDSCAEGAIRLVDGKARLVSDQYCDGLGACLGPCPAGAITLETRLADAFDAQAAEERVAAMKCPENKTAGDDCTGSSDGHAKPLACGCPGGLSRELRPSQDSCCGGGESEEGAAPAVSRLKNWPIQLALIPPSAPYLRGVDLLLAADCVPAAMPDFHARFLKNSPLIIACPKLDDNEAQVDKLAAILRTARPASLTVLRMDVPCCGGLVRVAEEATRRADSHTALQVKTVGIDGRIQ